MNAMKKSWLAGGLGTLAACVWLPQFLSLGGHEPPALPEISAEEPRAQARAVESAVVAAEPDALPVPGDEGSAPAAQLSQLEQSLNALARQGSTNGFDELLARLDPHSPQAGTASAVELDMDASSARQRLTTFAALQPFTGLVLGPNDGAALFGHRVVRQGDTLAGGEIRVLSIRAQGVELGLGVASLLVELPAFCARGGVSVSNDTANTPPAAAAAGEAPSAPAPQPAPAVAPAAEEKSGA